MKMSNLERVLHFSFREVRGISFIGRNRDCYRQGRERLLATLCFVHTKVFGLGIKMYFVLGNVLINEICLTKWNLL